MKKIVVFALLIFSAALSAQVEFKPGIRAGVNFARITQTDLDTKTDFYASAFGAIKFTKVYTLQPEIGYSGQGAKGKMYTYDYYYDEDGQYVEERTVTNANVRLNYFTLTMLNKFTFKERFSIMAGPTLNFELTSSPYLNSNVDIGLTGGFAYSFPMGLSIEGRVRKGIADVIDGDFGYSDGSYWLDDYNTNLVFQLGLSYEFDIK